MADRVVLVGGTGFLGSALSAELTRRGFETVIVARGRREKRHPRGGKAEAAPSTASAASGAGAASGASAASGAGAASGAAAAPAERRADILRPETLTGLLRPEDTVVHLVARSPVKRPRGGRGTYRRIHVEGTRNLLRAAEAAKVRRFIYLSALGVTGSAGAAYAETKAHAEELVTQASPASTIVAPSILFGAESELIGLLELLSRIPVVPLPRIEAPFRPIHVADAAARIADAITDPDPPAYLPLSGPEKLSFTDFVRRFLRERGTAFIALPASLTPALLSLVSALKIPGAPAELDRMLAIDNAGDPPPDPEKLTHYSKWVRRLGR
jgi:NADH dehydrogenase